MFPRGVFAAGTFEPVRVRAAWVSDDDITAMAATCVPEDSAELLAIEGAAA